MSEVNGYLEELDAVARAARLSIAEWQCPKCRAPVASRGACGSCLGLEREAVSIATAVRAWSLAAERSDLERSAYQAAVRSAESMGQTATQLQALGFGDEARALTRLRGEFVRVMSGWVDRGDTNRGDTK